MRITIDDARTVCTLVPSGSDDDAPWADVVGALAPETELDYHGCRRDDDHRLRAIIVTVGQRELVLSPTGVDDQRALGIIRDTCYHGSGGLIFLGAIDVDGVHGFRFTGSRCKHCDAPMLDFGRCEWKMCCACAATCTHTYMRGVVHGGKNQFGMGEFCTTCGRGKPEPEGTPEKTMAAAHLEVVRELGIAVRYKNLPFTPEEIVRLERGEDPEQVLGTARIAELRERQKPLILMVEDDAVYVTRTQRMLGDAVQLVAANTLEGGLTLFEEHKDGLALILMDACVPGDDPNAMWLVRKIRESGFTKPIIAISSMPDYRQMLIRAGASDECAKVDIPTKVRRVLQLAGA